MRFHKNILDLDCSKEIKKITHFIQEQVRSFRREGLVVGLSGGIDSALCAALCVKALGKEKVLGIILPEKESHPLSKEYALKQAQKLGIKTKTIDITSALQSLGTYKKRDHPIKKIFPEYNDSYRAKISLPPDLLYRDNLSIFTLTIEDDKGRKKKARPNRNALKSIIAATNTKQRIRMIHLYYYAEKMNYFVCGTTNRSEYIQGFYVKYGDGGADIEPLAHLYKTQVYNLSEDMNVIEPIIKRVPSPDTYSYEVSDEEYYFRIPFEKLDLLLYAWENKVNIPDVSQVMDLNEEQVKRVFRDFNGKHKATECLRKMPPSLK